VVKQPDDVPDEASCHYGQGFVHLGLILTAQVKDLAAKYVGHLQQFSQVLIHDGYFEGFESWVVERCFFSRCYIFDF
jgi:hypothetical protein